MEEAQKRYHSQMVKRSLGKQKHIDCDNHISIDMLRNRLAALADAWQQKHYEEPNKAI